MFTNFNDLQQHFLEHAAYESISLEIRLKCGKGKPLTRSTWSNWMRGKTIPTLPQQEQISKIVANYESTR